MSNSTEEEIARDYICFGGSDLTVVIVDATCLERNLNLVYQILEITNNVVVCVNLLDEAKRKGIYIDLNKLSNLLGVPVVGSIARKKKSLRDLMTVVNKVCLGEISCNPKKIKYDNEIEKLISIVVPSVQEVVPEKYKHLSRWIAIKLIDGDEKILSSIQTYLSIDFNNTNIQEALKEVNNIINNKFSFKDAVISNIILKCEETAIDVCSYSKNTYNNLDRKLDKIFTSKLLGFPIMILFLGLIFWITITGANYPSSILSKLFEALQRKLLIWSNNIGFPSWISNILINGMYQTVAWVVAVMLPPMAIFFPLFTLLEDLGYLPRIAFNLDKCFKKACTSGKQALTMCMGFGCNAAGVVGARIIDSPREKLIAILTNAFVPCNGRFPFLITIATIFIAGIISAQYSSIIATFTVMLIILLGIFLTLAISRLLSKTILKGVPSSFMLELPPYRRPQLGKILVRSLLDRTLFVLRKSSSRCSSYWYSNLAYGKFKHKQYYYPFACCHFLKSFRETTWPRWIYSYSIFAWPSCKRNSFANYFNVLYE